MNSCLLCTNGEQRHLLPKEWSHQTQAAVRRTSHGARAHKAERGEPCPVCSLIQLSPTERFRPAGHFRPTEDTCDIKAAKEQLAEYRWGGSQRAGRRTPRDGGGATSGVTHTQGFNIREAHFLTLSERPAAETFFHYRLFKAV